MKLIAASILSITILSIGLFQYAFRTDASLKFAKETQTPSPTPSSSPKPIIDVTSDGTDPFLVIREPSAQEYLDQGLGSDDADCDGVKNTEDNCTLVYNPKQTNSDGDEYGDACDTNLKGYKVKDIRCDRDKDGIFDDVDNCPLVCNPDQKRSSRVYSGGDACNPEFVNNATVERICKPSDFIPTRKLKKKCKQQ